MISNTETNAKTYLQNTITTTPNTDAYSKPCASRLPCGLCRITNAMCPFVSLQPSYISWDNNVYTNGFGQTIICSSEADNHVEGTN